MEIKDYCTGVQHIGVPTNDMEATIRFYEKLGFQIQLDVMNGEERVVFFQLHNLVIEAYQNNQAVMASGAVDHIAIDVKQIDELYAKVKADGFELLTEVNALPFWSNGIKYFIILGPNKERIEFCEKL